jgi:hypothetical protein
MPFVPLWYLQNVPFVGSEYVLWNGQAPAHYVG